MSQDAQTTTAISRRKGHHLLVVLSENPAISPCPNSLQPISLPRDPLPTRSLESISTSTKLLKRELSFPFIIASMTGGSQHGEAINKNLAQAAEQERVAFALGSLRILTKPGGLEQLPTFAVRNYCPSVPLIGNLGLTFLQEEEAVEHILNLVDTLQLDALYLHINPMQEAMQLAGDTDNSELLFLLEKAIPRIPVPVFVKEVGSGIPGKLAKQLLECGVAKVDVAGTGGTSWVAVERLARIAAYPEEVQPSEVFDSWGTSTADCLTEAVALGVAREQLIASGGIRSGLDIAKALSLGAGYTSAATPLLAPAMQSSEGVAQVLARWRLELRMALYSSGLDVPK